MSQANIPNSANSFVSDAAWAIYPLPPSQDAFKGETSVLSATTTGSTAYSACGTTALSGSFPNTGSWATPTATSQATLTPESIKTDSGSADSTTMTGPTGTTGTTGTPESTGTETTSSKKKMKRTDSLTAPVARETSTAVSSIPAGPGRRQLVGV